MAPLVEELNAFCRGHEDRDGDIAATEMLGGLWPGLAEISVPFEAGEERDPGHFDSPSSAMSASL